MRMRVHNGTIPGLPRPSGLVVPILMALLAAVTTTTSQPVPAAAVTPSTVEIPGACPPILPPSTAVNREGDQVIAWQCLTNGDYSLYPEVNVSYLPSGET